MFKYSTRLNWLITNFWCVPIEKFLALKELKKRIEVRFLYPLEILNTWNIFFSDSLSLSFFHSLSLSSVVKKLLWFLLFVFNSGIEWNKYIIIYRLPPVLLTNAIYSSDRFVWRMSERWYHSTSFTVASSWVMMTDISFSFKVIE